MNKSFFLKNQWGGGALHHNLQAFTLAEVLITLGIIGIVAAITLPALMTKVERNILKQQFKKTFSTYNQALMRTAIDFGGLPDCYYNISSDSPNKTAQCPEFFDKFANALKVIKICKGNALTQGCIPKYSAYASINDCRGFTENYINNINTAYVLTDGTILMPYNNGKTPIVAFDINGKKGPNTPGQDLFAVDITITNKGMLTLRTSDIVSCLPKLADRFSYEDFFK